MTRRSAKPRSQYTSGARSTTQLGAHKGATASFQTIVARYPGKCKRCAGPIAVGEAIRWAPKKGSWHLKDRCGSDDAALERYVEKYGDDDIPGDHVVGTYDTANGIGMSSRFVPDMDAIRAKLAPDLSRPVPESITGEVF